MDKNWYEALAEKSTAGELPEHQTCIDLLTDKSVDLLSLLHAAFAVRRRQSIKGKGILLVDDVCTTGTTALAASGALKAAGASNIKALALART